MHVSARFGTFSSGTMFCVLPSQSRLLTTPRIHTDNFEMILEEMTSERGKQDSLLYYMTWLVCLVVRSKKKLKQNPAAFPKPTAQQAIKVTQQPGDCG